MFCNRVVQRKFRLDAHHTWESGVGVDGDFVFFDRRGKVRLIIEESGRITVTKGYCWNGCSPKFCFLDLLFGTPDGGVYEPTGRPKAYDATLIHDVFYQFLGDGLPYSRREADRFLLQRLEGSQFKSGGSTGARSGPSGGSPGPSLVGCASGKGTLRRGRRWRRPG